MAWWHGQSTAVWSLSHAGRPVLGADLNRSESRLGWYVLAPDLTKAVIFGGRRSGPVAWRAC